MNNDTDKNDDADNRILNQILIVLAPISIIVVLVGMIKLKHDNNRNHPQHQQASQTQHEQPNSLQAETTSTFEELLQYEPLACDKAYHKATDCEYVLSGKSAITRDEVCLSQEIKMQLYPRYGEKCIQAHIDVYNCMASVQSCFNYGQEMLNRCDSALAKANVACGNNP